MDYKAKILIMFANQYDVDGSRGTTVNYYFWGEHGEKLEPTANFSGAVGQQRSKVSLDFNAREKITFVPGLYDASFEFSVGSDGKPVAKLKDVEFSSKVNFSVASAGK